MLRISTFMHELATAEATATGVAAAGAAAAGLAVEPAPPMKVAGGLLWIALLWGVAGAPATGLAGDALPAAGSHAAGLLLVRLALLR